MSNRPTNFKEALREKQQSRRLHDVELLVDENKIQQLMRGRVLIDTATDGSYDPATGKMAYGWIMAINEIFIAEGKGPAEASQHLAEAFRAEAYGLCAATTFIQVFLQYFIGTGSRPRWFFHIDNRTLINRMERYNTSDASAKWNHEPDIDVTNMVHKNLHGIEAQFLHIKSHQDRQRKSETLSFPARLNIRADQLATDQQELMKQPETTVTTNFHHLVIETHFITRESQKWLLDYASRIPIQQYYHDKYGWSSKTFRSIDWDLQHKVLRRYGVNNQ
jgi:hypothetical protein